MKDTAETLAEFAQEILKTLSEWENEETMSTARRLSGVEVTGTDGSEATGGRLSNGSGTDDDVAQ